MNIHLKNISEIKGGLSKKKVFRKTEKRINKIVIDFSEDKEDFYNFLKVYKLLIKINISIPRIYEVYPNKNLIVMEDFGEKTFDKIFDEKKIYNLLKLGIDNLIIIHNSICRDDLVNLKEYTYSKFIEEISEFVNYYIPYKKISNFNSNYFYKLWNQNLKKNSFSFDSFSHKDFEFINLFLLNKNKSHLKCGIIDFQSAFIGFIGWDLFSLLENPRLNFTRKYNDDLIKYFYENINFASSFDTFKSQYYLLNLGRQTRLLGRWIKLSNQGNKHYLKFVQSTQNRLVSCLKYIEDKNLIKVYKKVLLF